MLPLKWRTNMELDIAEFRKMEAELHGFELPGFSMKFYYDETRNARKFRVSSNGVIVVML